MGIPEKLFNWEPLIHLTETWRNALDKGLKVGVLFIDFRKAFDTVNHTILLEKLKAIGVSGDLLSWLDDYLSARKQFVQSSGFQSKQKTINSPRVQDWSHDNFESELYWPIASSDMRQ